MLNKGLVQQFELNIKIESPSYSLFYIMFKTLACLQFSYRISLETNDLYVWLSFFPDSRRHAKVLSCKVYENGLKNINLSVQKLDGVKWTPGEKQATGLGNPITKKKRIVWCF